MTPDDAKPTARPPKTWGTLLAEIGVVVAIIAVLMCLLLPNVSRVRVPAARMADSNNLKQLALAEHNNDAQHETGLIGPYAQVSPGALNTELSFRVSLLPYLEQDNVYRLIDCNQPWDSPKNSPATSADGCIAGVSATSFTAVDAPCFS